MVHARLPLLTRPAQCHWIGRAYSWRKHRHTALDHVSPRRQSRSSSSATAPAAAATEAVSDEFNTSFAEQWGARWPALRAALAAPTRHVALCNTFLQRPLTATELPGAAALDARQPHLAALLAAVGGAHCAVQALYWQRSDAPGSDNGRNSSGSSGWGYPPPPADPATGLLTHYWLDAASLLPPLLLDVQPGQAVLDMCAAPGGKSLVLAQLLLAREHAAAAADENAGPEGFGSSSSNGSSASGESNSSDAKLSRRSRAAATPRADAGEQEGSSAAFSGSLVCNELDAARRGRLVRVLRDYVPVPARYRIRVTPHDGARFWGRHEAEQYDRVLLDAPCSSDRHVLQQAAARGSSSSGSIGSDGGAISVPRADWSLQRCRRIANKQVKLLAAAAQALKAGGRVVYSTCSILDLENDQVVDRVLERGGGSLRVLQTPEAAAALDAAGAQRMRHGWLLLPDGPLGCGPIYLALLEKTASSSFKRVKVNKYEGKKKAA